MTYCILASDGPGVVELYARESRDEIVRLFRGVTQPACIAHGATVLQVNSRGKSREAAFKKFAAQGETAAPVARVTALAVPETPMPAREPVKMSLTVESTEVTVESDDNDSDDADAAPGLPTAASVAPAQVCTRGLGCARPTARVQRRTKPGTEGWCTPCRRVVGAKEQRHAEKAAASKPARAKPAAKVKPPKKGKPSQSAKSAKLPTLADALALAQRHSAAIARLGGIESAEGFAGFIESSGGIAAVFDALLGFQRIGARP